MEYCAPLGIPHSKFLQWDSDDRDKAIAWQLRRMSTCPRCRTRDDEWEHDHHAYVAEKVRCRGCEVREAAEASLTQEDGRGAYVTLRKRR